MERYHRHIVLSEIGFDGQNLVFGLGPEMSRPELKERLSDTREGVIVEDAAPPPAAAAPPEGLLPALLGLAVPAAGAPPD